MPKKQDIKNELDLLIADGQEVLTKLATEEEKLSIITDYQAWYSRALPAVEKLGRDRYEEFRRYYEPDPRRKDFGYGSYVIQDYVKGVVPNTLRYPNFDSRNQAAIGMYNQVAILKSLSVRIDSLLLDIEGTLYAALQDAEIDTAKHLVKISPRGAGALAGVILEAHLQTVSTHHHIKISKKSPTLSDLNDPLKDAGIYDIPTWRKITYLADIRNLCSHRKTADPTIEQVSELIDGVDWAIKNIS